MTDLPDPSSPDMGSQRPEELIEPTVPESGATTQIPVIESVDGSDQPPAEQSPTTDTQTDSQDTDLSDPDEGRVEHDKAEDMARAGKSERDEANRLRESAKGHRDTLTKVDEWRSDPFRNGSISEQNQHFHEGMRLVDELYYVPVNGRRLRYDIGYLKRQGLSQADLEKVEQASQHLEQEADTIDAQADRIEDWAAVLHDHPVSEAYKAAHANYAFEPAELVERERNTSALKSETAHIETLLDKHGPMVGVRGFFDGRVVYKPEDVMKQAYRLSPDEYKHYSEAGETLDRMGLTDAQAKKLDEYLRLINNPQTTTLQQLNDYFLEGFKLAYLEPRKRIIDADSRVLDDVRSGRASETPPEA